MQDLLIQQEVHVRSNVLVHVQDCLASLFIQMILKMCKYNYTDMDLFLN